MEDKIQNKLYRFTNFNRVVFDAILLAINFEPLCLATIGATSKEEKGTMPLSISWTCLRCKIVFKYFKKYGTKSVL